MKTIRRVHSWLGVLFAPSIILFAFSGILQMSGCHESEGGSEAPGWIVRLAQIHMKQTAAMPRRRAPRPAPAAATAPSMASAPSAPNPPSAPSARDGKPGAAPTAKEPSPSAEPPNTAPLRIFFFLMSIGLIATSVLGLYVAFVSKRDRRLLIGLLAAGTILPIVLLLV